MHLHLFFSTKNKSQFMEDITWKKFFLSSADLMHITSIYLWCKLYIMFTKRLEVLNKASWFSHRIIYKSMPTKSLSKWKCFVLFFLFHAFSVVIRYCTDYNEWHEVVVASCFGGTGHICVGVHGLSLEMVKRIFRPILGRQLIKKLMRGLYR